MELFSVLFAIIWMFVIISIITSIVKGASKNKTTQQQMRQRLQSQYMAPQQNPAVRQGGQQNFRSVPGSTYGSSSTGSRSAVPGSYRSTPAQDVKTSSLLFEDRRNDWLAQQFREEDLIKRRGMLADLGAMHEVECAADMLKQDHIRRHNSNGLNKRTFR